MHLLQAAPAAFCVQSFIRYYVFHKICCVISRTRHYSNQFNIHRSNLGAGSDDLLGRLFSIFLEVLNEQATQFRNFFFKVSRSCPGFCWVEQLRGNTGARRRYWEIEGFVGLKFSLGKLAWVDGIENCPCVFQSVFISTTTLDVGRVRLTGNAYHQS